MSPNPLAVLLDPLLLAKKQHHRCLMASSYDRRGGNHDWSNYVRREGSGAVLMEADGPSCITRIWTADPQKGTIRVYVDDMDSPLYECPFDKLFTRLPLTSGLGGESDANYSRSKEERVPMGFTSYASIPFARKAKVVIDPEDDYLYYQINYLKYPQGTVLDKSLIEAAVPLVTQMQSDWELGRSRYESSGYITKVIHLKAGTAFEQIPPGGPSAILSLRLRLPRFDRQDVEKHVKENLWLAMHFDDDEMRDPSVYAPIGPLFMDYGQKDRHRSFFVGSEADGEYYIEFAMPYYEQARISLINRGIVDVEGIELRILTEPNDPEFAYQRFKATWHIETPFGPNHRDYNGVACRLLNLDGRDNYEILNVRGGGHFVGCGFHIDLRDAPTDRAAGEGDEMFFIDDDPRYTLYGTGTEDYVNDAWGIRGYVGPISGDSLSGDWGKDPQIYGYRLHIADCIPFVHRARFTLEHGTGNNCSGLYRSVAYWYTDQAAENTKREERFWESIGKST